MPHQRVGDVELFYRVVDYCEPWTHDRTPLIFIHGLGGTHAMWLYQVPDFCRRFPVIVVDLRNHGESGKINAEFGIADMAADVVRLLRVLGVEAAHVVGLSLGGMVAQQLALDYPTTVAGLVLADTMSGLAPEFASMGREAIAFIENNPMKVVAQARITNAFSPAVDPDVRDYYIDQVALNDKAAYVRAARAAFGFDVGARLGHIKRPTLVVVGEQDTVTPPALSEQLAAGIPDAKLVRIHGAGHIANVERPTEFNNAVLDFLLTL